MRHNHFQRRGAVLVAVMVVMMVAALLFGAMLRTGREEQQWLRRHQQRLQAEELAQAALERAAARLAGDAPYQSEVWQISAAELGGRETAAVTMGRETAAVTIQIQPIADHPRRRRALIQVDYPQAPERRIRFRHEAMIDE
jgi:type II secretory pathway component PulK